VAQGRAADDAEARPQAAADGLGPDGPVLPVGQDEVARQGLQHGRVVLHMVGPNYHLLAGGGDGLVNGLEVLGVEPPSGPTPAAAPAARAVAHVHLVHAGVEVPAGEQLGHLGDDFLQQRQRARVGRADGVEAVALPAVGQFGVLWQGGDGPGVVGHLARALRVGQASGRPTWKPDAAMSDVKVCRQPDRNRED